jgi:ribosome recycling factor
MKCGRSSDAMKSNVKEPQMDQDEILLDAEERMEKAVQILHSQLQGLRTGRATSGLVDSIRVDFYGSPTPLKQIANISIPEPQQILIRPFDASTLTAIAKAIQSSDTGLSPNSDGRVIRLNVPPLSNERRRQLVAREKELAEEARVAIRNVRRDANKHADQGEKDKSLTEDDCKQTKDQIQELTKKHEAKVSEMAAAKEKEIMND